MIDHIKEKHSINQSNHSTVRWS